MGSTPADEVRHRRVGIQSLRGTTEPAALLPIHTVVETLLGRFNSLAGGSGPSETPHGGVFTVNLLRRSPRTVFWIAPQYVQFT